MVYIKCHCLGMWCACVRDKDWEREREWDRERERESRVKW